jgi:hypothetical protein
MRIEVVKREKVTRLLRQGGWCCATAFEKKWYGKMKVQKLK